MPNPCCNVCERQIADLDSCLSLVLQDAAGPCCRVVAPQAADAHICGSCVVALDSILRTQRDSIPVLNVRVNIRDRREPMRERTIEAVMDAVSRHLGVSVADLLSERRDGCVAFPRQIAMYLSRILAGAEYRSIAEYFGRDDSTVMHAVRVVELRRYDDDKVFRLLNEIIAEFQPQEAQSA